MLEKNNLPWHKDYAMVLYLGPKGIDKQGLKD